MIAASLNSSPSSSWLAWLILIAVFACVGGVLVFVGLLLEKVFEKKSYLNMVDFWCCKSWREIGWKILMVGIFVEIVSAGAFAIRGEIENRQNAKNNPLKQPVSQVYAILRFEINATNFDIKKPVSLDSSWMSVGDYGFSAKEARWFEHLDDIYTRHVKYYGIALKFEQNTLPSWEWNDIYSTNPYDFFAPTMTVTDAISKTTVLRGYVDFIPKNTEVLKCSVQVFFNGYKRDFRMTSNCISGQYSEWNPDKPGIFLDATNSIP
jgi:hypothetical protein